MASSLSGIFPLHPGFNAPNSLAVVKLKPVAGPALVVESVTQETMGDFLVRHPDLRDLAMSNAAQARTMPNCAGVNFVYIQASSKVSSLVPLMVGNASRGVSADEYEFEGADWKMLLETPGALEQHLNRLNGTGDA